MSTIHTKIMKKDWAEAYYVLEALVAFAEFESVWTREWRVLLCCPLRLMTMLRMRRRRARRVYFQDHWSFLRHSLTCPQGRQPTGCYLLPKSGRFSEECRRFHRNDWRRLRLSRIWLSIQGNCQASFQGQIRSRLQARNGSPQ